MEQARKLVKSRAGGMFKAIRNQLSIGQAKFGEKLDPENPVSGVTISRWERGKFLVPLEKMRKARELIKRSEVPSTRSRQKAAVPQGARRSEARVAEKTFIGFDSQDLDVHVGKFMRDLSRRKPALALNFPNSRFAVTLAAEGIVDAEETSEVEVQAFGVFVEGLLISPSARKISIYARSTPLLAPSHAFGALQLIYTERPSAQTLADLATGLLVLQTNLPLQIVYNAGDIGNDEVSRLQKEFSGILKPLRAILDLKGIAIGTRLNVTVTNNAYSKSVLRKTQDQLFNAAIKAGISRAGFLDHFVRLYAGQSEADVQAAHGQDMRMQGTAMGLPVPAHFKNARAVRLAGIFTAMKAAQAGKIDEETRKALVRQDDLWMMQLTVLQRLVRELMAGFEGIQAVKHAA
jgi:hypothetical protein